MAAKKTKPETLCSTCRRRIAVNDRGLIRAHKWVLAQEAGPGYHCSGSGRPPRALFEKPRDGE